MEENKMIETVNQNNFTDAFKTYFSGQYKDNFSYEGLKALYDYLEGYEEATDKKVELDVIALCCEYSEYKNFKEFQNNYDDIVNLDDLKDNTTVIEIPNSERFIIQDF